MASKYEESYSKENNSRKKKGSSRKFAKNAPLSTSNNQRAKSHSLPLSSKENDLPAVVEKKASIGDTSKTRTKYRQLDASYTRKKNNYSSELETTNTTKSEEKYLDTKCIKLSDASPLESSKEVDLSLEPVETANNANSSNAADTSCKSSDNDSWDSMFDDDGECNNPGALKELTAAVQNMKLTKSKYNNSHEFQPSEPDVNNEDFGCIVEFYDLPEGFKSHDILTITSAFKNEAFNIKWVDDDHALGVFSTPFAAMNILSLKHPLLKVRPLSKGIRASKLKAKGCEELHSYRHRPDTLTTTARRLVSSALNIKLQIPKEERELERKKLKEMKDRRRQVLKQRQDIWDGVV